MGVGGKCGLMTNKKSTPWVRSRWRATLVPEVVVFIPCVVGLQLKAIPWFFSATEWTFNVRHRKPHLGKRGPFQASPLRATIVVNNVVDHYNQRRPTLGEATRGKALGWAICSVDPAIIRE